MISVAPVAPSVGRSAGPIDSTDPPAKHAEELQASARVPRGHTESRPSYMPAVGYPADTIVELAQRARRRPDRGRHARAELHPARARSERQRVGVAQGALRRADRALSRATRARQLLARARTPLRSAPSISPCQSPAVCSPANASGPTRRASSAAIGATPRRACRIAPRTHGSSSQREINAVSGSSSRSGRSLLAAASSQRSGPSATSSASSARAAARERSHERQRLPVGAELRVAPASVRHRQRRARRRRRPARGRTAWPPARSEPRGMH